MRSLDDEVVTENFEINWLVNESINNLASVVRQLRQKAIDENRECVLCGQAVLALEETKNLADVIGMSEEQS